MTPEEDARTRGAILAVESIKEKIASGGEFTRPSSAKFFADSRDRIKEYGHNTRFSSGQLQWLQDIDRAMRIRKAAKV